MKFPNNLSVGVAAFLAGVDKILVDRNVLTCGTAIHEGELLLVLGQLYLDAPLAQQRMFLQHEAGHFFMGHLMRCGDRDPQIWNLAVDACLHGHGNCQHGDDFPAVTWKRLGLTPMPAEAAYEQLLKKAEEHKGECGCDSMSSSQISTDVASLRKAASISQEMMKDPKFRDMVSNRAGGNTGSLSSAYIEAAPPPPWIREVMDYLMDKAYDSSRSWRRENRAYSDLPGRAEKHGRAGLFLIDASGSISPNELSQFLGAVVNTPELIGSMAIAYSHVMSPKVPVAQAQKAISDVAGGGTLFLPPATLREPGQTVVWLTDGYPCDGWPDPHDGPEVFVITTDVKPPHGIHIPTMR